MSSTPPVESESHALKTRHACAVTGSPPSFWAPPRLVQNSSLAVRVDPPPKEVGERLRLKRTGKESRFCLPPGTAPLAWCRIGSTLHTTLHTQTPLGRATRVGRSAVPTHAWYRAAHGRGHGPGRSVAPESRHMKVMVSLQPLYI